MAHAANRPRFALAVAQCERELRVLRFTGDERLSAPFAFTIDVACTDPDLDLATLLDCEALLQIDSPASDLSRPRMVHGAICRAEFLVSGKRWSQYRLHLAPRLYWLGLRYNVRIFQDMTAPDIVRQLLQEAGLDNARFRFELSRAYRRRTYCVQYNESELAFIQRLLADEGIHYHFEHLEDRHVAVLGDHGQSFKPLTPRAVAIRADAAMVGEPVISRFEPQRSLVLDAFASTDYNFRKPGHSQFVNAQAGSASQQEHYQWPGGHEDTSQGDQIVKDRLAQARVEQDLAEGASSVVQLVPGQVFELQQHRRADFNQDWLLLSLHHEGAQPQVLEEEAPDGQGTQYQNTLTAIPASQTYRPAPCTKPQVPGVQTAVVIGPPGEQIYTDEHGRIKVRFHWDREGKNSCWLRLDQGWADHNWGSMVLPRVGQEVVVSFLHGDPDQPLVTGCLYHGLHKTPYPLPDHRSRSVLRTQSLSGNGGHELMLEDRAGQEKIAIHSARDFELHVTQDAHTSIDRHAQTHIAADDLLAIQGSEHLQIQGERRSQIDGQDSLTIGASQHLKAGTAIHVQAGQEIHLKAGSVLHIDAGMELSIQGGGSSLTLNPAGVFLTGPLINLNSGGGGASASPATPKAPQLPVKIGEKKAGKAASEAAAREKADVDELSFQQLQKEPIKGNFADTKYLLAATGNAPLAAVAQNTLPGTQNAATSLTPNITAVAQGLASQAVDAVLSTVNQAKDAITPEEPKVHVVAGMFFDGTGNNAAHSRERRQMLDQCLTAYDIKSMGRQECEQALALLDDSFQNDISNIAKLHDLYLVHTETTTNSQTHYLRQYIAGIGTKTGDEDSGFGMGTGMGELGVVAKVKEGTRELARQLTRLGNNKIDLLILDIFGFSRGAAAARHFANEILKGPTGALGQSLSRRGIPWPARVEIRFVGLFDTVAAIFNPLRNDWSPHNDENAPVNLFLPPDRIQRAVQLVAQDERRHNFSLNSLRNMDGSLPANFNEWALPGVHSDIGGGYSPSMIERLLVAPIAYVKGVDLQKPEQSYEYRKLEAFKQEVEQEGWLGPHNQPPGRLYIERIDQPGIDRIILKLLLERPVRGEYSRIPLRLMHELSTQEGVPFDRLDDTLSDYRLPKELEPVEQVLRQFVLEEKPLNIPPSLGALIRQLYHHRSDHFGNIGPVTPHLPAAKGRGTHPNVP